MDCGKWEIITDGNSQIESDATKCNRQKRNKVAIKNKHDKQSLLEIVTVSNRPKTISGLVNFGYALYACVDRFLAKNKQTNKAQRETHFVTIINRDEKKKEK